MPPSTATAETRLPTAVEQLWNRLAEMYGAENLKRRYGPTPPLAWREVIDALPVHELTRAVRRLTHGGNPHLPTLPEFLKLAKAVGDDHEPVKPFNALPNPNNPGNWDAWVLTGNRHLMAEIYRNPRRFTVRNHIAITEILVQAKNRWVETMRQTDAEDREDGGKAIWDSLMRQAEAEIAKRLAGQQSVEAS